MRLVSESPLFRKERVLVKAEALALHDHDPLDEVVASVMPPVVDGQIGFGLCERKGLAALDPTAVLRKQAAIKGLLHRPMPPPKRSKLSEPTSSSSTPLLDKEKNAKL